MNVNLKLFLAAVLFLAALVLYGPFLHNPPFFDDIKYFEFGQLDNVFLQGFVFGSRWLPYFSMAWISLLFEDGLLAQRVVSLGTHLLTAYVLYTLVKQVSDRAAPHANNERAAFAAALLFVLHPLAVYAAGYLIQRTILMATVFGLLSLNTYFDGLVTRKKAYFLFSALFYFFSAYSKEHAVLIPAVALAMTPLAGPINRKTWRELILPFALFAPIGILVILQRWGLVGQVYEPFSASIAEVHLGTQNPTLIWGLSVMTQAALFFKYLGLMLVPWPSWMSIDMRVPIATELWNPKYVLAVIAFVIYGGIATKLLLKGGRWGLIGFALLAPWLQFLVEFSAARIQEPFVLYRAYLWMVPLFVLIPAVSSKLPNVLFWPIVLMTALAFGLASNDRLTTFSSGYALWDDAVRKLPSERAMGSARTYSNRCAWNLRREAWQEGINDCTRALSVNPSHKEAYRNRAWANRKLGNYSAALRDANTMINLYPKDPTPYIVRGQVYSEMGNADLAIKDFQYGCDQGSMGACVALETTKKTAGAADQLPVERK